MLKAHNLSNDITDSTISNTLVPKLLLPFTEDESNLPNIHLRSLVCRPRNFEEFLLKLNDSIFLRKIIEILFRNTDSLCDLKPRSIDYYNILPELLNFSFEDESLKNNTDISSQYSEDEISNLIEEENKVQALLEIINECGYSPQWIFEAKEICSYARYSSSYLTDAYNVIAATHATLYDVSHMFLKHVSETVLEKFNSQYTFEPALCFTEKGRCPGKLHSWTLNTFEESKSHTGLKSYWIWMDAPFGFLLLKNGQPQAICSFSIDKKSNSLVVEQIQGISSIECLQDGEESCENPKHFPPDLYGINFRPLMLAIVEQIARSSNFEQTVVIGSENNIWTKPNNWKEFPTYTVEQAQKHYDDVARAAWYTKNSDGNWINLV